MESAFISATHPFEGCVKPSEPTDAVLIFFHQQNGKSRRERKRDKRRNADRDRDRYGKLFVEKPGRSGEESYGDKNRSENKRSSNNSACNFTQRFPGRIHDRCPGFVQNA